MKGINNIQPKWKMMLMERMKHRAKCSHLNLSSYLNPRINTTTHKQLTIRNLTALSHSAKRNLRNLK